MEYAPPLAEFGMLRTELGRGEGEVVGKVGGPSVLWVLGGEGRMEVCGEGWEVREGWVFFVGCGVEVGFVAGEEGLVVYRAFAE